MSKFKKAYNASFFQIAVMYEVHFGEALPPNKSYESALKVDLKDAFADNEAGFGWLVEQSQLCQNAKLSIPEAVKVINGRIAYDDEYSQSPQESGDDESGAGYVENA